MPRTLLPAGIAALLLAAAPACAQPAASAKLKNVVLVHGAWADGSGWKAVSDRLTRDGYKVMVVQHPTIDLPTDVAYTRRVIAATDGDVVLVGHSYGGAVVTEAGNDPKVKALVYIAAFEPDQGETVDALAMKPVPGASPPPVLPPKDGFLLIDPARFPQAFAQDVDPSIARFMATSQVPWGLAAGTTPITNPAWKTKPVWALVTTRDRMIPPATQSMMVKRSRAAVTEVSGDHAVYVSNPDVVARLIEKAAHGMR